MRRFPLTLSDEVYNDFLRCFPDHGERTALLRKFVLKMIKRAKLKGNIWETEFNNIVDEFILE